MRETKKIILPKSNIVVEIYTYLSQRGYEAIKEPFFRNEKLKFIQGKGIITEEEKEISMDAMKEANEANIKYMLHSFDGNTGSPDQLLDMTKDLNQKDYSFIVEEINKVTKESEEEELKKKSEDQT